jgi:hypothetical protein
MWAHPELTGAQRWAELTGDEHGLNFWATFAGQHGKPMVLDEWALTSVNAQISDGGGGGDDPYFIDATRDWIRANDVTYECYFDYDAPDGQHAVGPALSEFPAGAAEYRKDFEPHRVCRRLRSHERLESCQHRGSIRASCVNERFG